MDTKTSDSSIPEVAKVEEEVAKVEETKVEETKVEETKVEETKVEEVKVEGTKAEEIKKVEEEFKVVSRKKVRSGEPHKKGSAKAERLRKEKEAKEAKEEKVSSGCGWEDEVREYEKKSSKESPKGRIWDDEVPEIEGEYIPKRNEQYDNHVSSRGYEGKGNKGNKGNKGKKDDLIFMKGNQEYRVFRGEDVPVFYPPKSTTVYKTDPNTGVERKQYYITKGSKLPPFGIRCWGRGGEKKDDEKFLIVGRYEKNTYDTKFNESYQKCGIITGERGFGVVFIPEGEKRERNHHSSNEGYHSDNQERREFRSKVMDTNDFPVLKKEYEQTPYISGSIWDSQVTKKLFSSQSSSKEETEEMKKMKEDNENLKKLIEEKEKEEKERLKKKEEKERLKEEERKKKEIEDMKKQLEIYKRKVKSLEENPVVPFQKLQIPYEDHSSSKGTMVIPGKTPVYQVVDIVPYKAEDFEADEKEIKRADDLKDETFETLDQAFKDTDLNFTSVIKSSVNISIETRDRLIKKLVDENKILKKKTENPQELNKAINDVMEKLKKNFSNFKASCTMKTEENGDSEIVAKIALKNDKPGTEKTVAKKPPTKKIVFNKMSNSDIEPMSIDKSLISVPSRPKHKPHPEDIDMEDYSEVADPFGFSF